MAPVHREMFAGEAEGLRAMFHTRAFAIPEVLHYGPLLDRGGHPKDTGSFIVMDYLDIRGGGGQAECVPCMEPP